MPSTFECLVHLATSWGLFGLIWMVQLVHYPSFRYIDETQFLEFHQHHTQTISIIVIPLMLLELGLCIWQVYQSNYDWFWLFILILVILIWASTFFLQVPLHNQLIQGKDLPTIQSLISSNWIRTVLWTVKAGVISVYWIQG